MNNYIDASQDLIHENNHNDITRSVIYGYTQVGEFHEIFGHPLHKELQTDILQSKVNFRFSLINEEYNELIEAYSKQDHIECIDAIMDLLYVTYGTYHTFGINIHQQNFSKINITNTDINYTLNMLSHHIFDLQAVCNATNKKFSLIQNELKNIIEKCYFLAQLFNVSVDLCFSEVHRSNLTKVCDTEELAKESVKWYIQNEPRYKDPDYRKSTNPKYFVIYDRATSKILKSIKFELPNLKQFFKS